MGAIHKPKPYRTQFLNLEVVRYAIPGPWSILAPIGIKRLYEFQRIRCTICFTSPDNHQKKKTTPASRVPACSSCHVVMSVLSKVLHKTEVSGSSERLHAVRNVFHKGSQGTAGTAGHHKNGAKRKGWLFHIT